MKNTIKSITLSCATLLLFLPAISGITNAKASVTNNTSTENNQSIQINNSEQEESALDPYVDVVNNQYVLNLPDNNSFSSATIEKANATINQTNEFIKQNNLTINPETKTGDIPANSLKDSPFVNFSYGFNGHGTFHWNYVRIYIDKGTANGIKAGTIGASSALVGKIPNPYLLAAAGACVGLLAMLNINNGIWFDYNYWTGITAWGWQ